jgi:hypothetical protein
VLGQDRREHARENLSEFLSCVSSYFPEQDFWLEMTSGWSVVQQVSSMTCAPAQTANKCDSGLERVKIRTRTVGRWLDRSSPCGATNTIALIAIPITGAVPSFKPL